MLGVEKEVSEMSLKSDLLRRAAYNCLTASVKDRNDVLAEAHFNEFRALLRELGTMTEDVRRKRDQLKNGDAT